MTVVDKLDAPIVQIDVHGARVRVQCPYHRGVGGHTHWIDLLREGVCAVTGTDEYLVKAGCVVGKYLRIDLKGCGND